jgi:hypothetical protein
MSRITPDHLARHAYVYVRQSTPAYVNELRVLGSFVWMALG